MAGIKRFQQRMRAIPLAVREGTQPALVKGAEEIAALQRRFAPKDEGDLEDSITVTGPGDGRNSELASSVSTDDPNARWQEFGTVKQAAQPFFWPAFRMLRKRSANRIKREMSKAVKANWGQGS